ncbi:hypothetical protein CEXT_523111 [Caerostris extrusa]|uniref:guanylate cyclase n=1 Tax=Caerostris extrusa TaxID=172846 RepID=A0AAV4VMF3_CAEEX|nr:hypothetical protein CEXT_523111 [Caerostris extrusa]
MGVPKIKVPALDLGKREVLFFYRRGLGLKRCTQRYTAPWRSFSLRFANGRNEHKGPDDLVSRVPIAAILRISVVKGLSGLVGKGLYISDIPIHDATRDIMLVEEQTKAQDGLKREWISLKIPYKKPVKP